MVKHLMFQCILAGLLMHALGQGQHLTGLERRVAELEDKMRLVDPAFGRESRASDLSRRLELLEKKMAEVLEARQPAVEARALPSLPATAPPTPTPAQPAGPGLVPVSVTGDYQGSPGGETRLPVAGYMDFHFNKDAGGPFRPDFHRFVLLFGHSFSDRIKFWSELEVEHALVEGGEESGEVALEQAYLDFLINQRSISGGHDAPRSASSTKHNRPFNEVERPFVETVISRLPGANSDSASWRPRQRLPLPRLRDVVSRRQPLNAQTGITEGRTAGDSSFHNPAKVAAWSTPE